MPTNISNSGTPMIPNMMPGQMPMNGMMPMMYQNMQQRGDMSKSYEMRGGGGRGGMNQNIKTKSEINEKYKTERCRHYETHKNCALGDMCHFAHGDAELRKPDDPLNPE